MWVQPTSAPAASRNSVRRRAQTRRQPTTWVVPIELSPGQDRRLDPDLRGANEPGQPALDVPGSVEPDAAPNGTRPDPARSAAGQRSAAARPARPRRTGPDTAREHVSAAGPVTPARGAAPSSSSVSRATSPVLSCGAVCARAGRRTTAGHRTRRARPRAARPRRPRAPRVVELVKDVGVDPARAPLAVVRLGGAVGARRSRRTGGSRPDTIEQDPSLAPHRRGRDPRAPAAARSAPRRSRHGTGCGPVAAFGDRERRPSRIASDRRSAPSARPRRGRRTASGTSSATRPGRVVSPFMTARARTRWAGVASARRSAARATSGSAWIPA